MNHKHVFHKGNDTGLCHYINLHRVSLKKLLCSIGSKLFLFGFLFCYNGVVAVFWVYMPGGKLESGSKSAHFASDLDANSISAASCHLQSSQLYDVQRQGEGDDQDLESTRLYHLQIHPDRSDIGFCCPKMGRL
uniref:Uncharacterized protein n=1 Tax=Aplanochytrium stocchinoi TaxID=215587 RepID=A0A7S3PQS8_9STRA